MGFILHCSNLLETQLAELRQSCRKGKMAAQQSEKILKTIRKEGFNCREIRNKRTKNGESRINNCVKYSLGNGYRMITKRQGSHFFVLFVGHHDKADLWLELHKQETFSEDDNRFTAEVISSQSDNLLSSYTEESKYQQSRSECDEYEERLKKKLDDAVLRSIFHGLVE